MLFKKYSLNTFVFFISMAVNISYAEIVSSDNLESSSQQKVVSEETIDIQASDTEIAFDVVEDTTSTTPESESIDVELEIDIEALTSELDSNGGSELGDLKLEDELLNALNEKDELDKVKDSSIDIVVTEESLEIMVNSQYEEQLKYARYYLGVSYRDELFTLYKIILDDKQPSSEKYSAKARIADIKQQALITAQNLIYDEVGYFFHSTGPYQPTYSVSDGDLNFEEYRVGDMAKTPKEVFELAANPRTRKKADDWMRELKVRRYLQAIKEIETLI